MLQIAAPVRQQQQQQPPPALPGLDPQTAATVMAQYQQQQQQQQQMHQQNHHHQQQQHPAWMPMGPPQSVNSHGQYGGGDLEEGERAETDEDIQVGNQS